MQRKSPAAESKGAAAADSSSKPKTLTRNVASPSGAQSVNDDWQSVVPAVSSRCNVCLFSDRT